MSLCSESPSAFPSHLKENTESLHWLLRVTGPLPSNKKSHLLPFSLWLRFPSCSSPIQSPSHFRDFAHAVPSAWMFSPRDPSWCCPSLPSRLGSNITLQRDLPKAPHLRWRCYPIYLLSFLLCYSSRHLQQFATCKMFVFIFFFVHFWPTDPQYHVIPWRLFFLPVLITNQINWESSWYNGGC